MDVIDFLEGLKLTLEHLKSYVDGNTTDSRASSISDQIEKIKTPFKAFQETVEKYEKSLGEASTRGRFERVSTTIKWALKEISGDVEKLKVAIMQPIQIINTLLSLQLL
ncbi:uncharacterized protein BDZ99DRAFT_465029 [Mytilinidion resinicola]|uniref:NACHT-NTPase and P-loop NTPases N-terminal domain-containing protein n=1 Tax=Mytilinidion resinicola TaxID=574789 RepID=A0A6A6YGR9_9PEZI|nr:uncharacterized protein BDZ99DRAFT_465029 [Mytilinidion resinicola]KAF2807097.1 hypothetical protein BDZ99DRAFT_465029 [Mytilinidion resinicola]